MPAFLVKYITLASGEKVAIRYPDEITIVQPGGVHISGIVTDANTGSISIKTRGDIMVDDPILSTNNTFNIKTMDDTINHLLTRNHTKLMQFEYHRLNIKRYDLKFNDFTEEVRLTKKSEPIYYPKRYTHYEYDRFIHENQRRDYRCSDVFHEPVNMLEIAARPNIFYRNFLVFIDGRLANTCEIYPLDDRIGFIIDVATAKCPHGISFETFKDFRNRNVDVTVFLLPNFNIGIMDANVPLINKYEGLIPFKNISGFKDKFEPKPVAEPMIFYNDGNDLALGVQGSDESIRFEYNDDVPESLWIDAHDIGSDIVKRRFVCIQFPYQFDLTITNSIHTCFDMTKNQVPIPIDNFLPMRVITNNGFKPEHKIFDPSITYHAFYPNIYAVGNILPHANKLPSFDLTTEASDVGITVGEFTKCEIPYELPDETDITLVDYSDNPFTLEKGIYTLHHLHLLCKKNDEEFIIPNDVKNTLDVENYVIRLFEEGLTIIGVKFMGSTPESNEIPLLIHPVIEPGETYHNDILEPGLTVTNDTIETRVFYLNLDIDIDLYHNDLKEYNYYRSLFEDYVEKEVPYPLITYNQNDFICEYKDYKESIWVPSLVNYRFARLRAYLERYPNFIRTYINRLRLPIEKYYIEMVELDLTKRVRMDTKSEGLVGNDEMVFDEPYLVFAMPRQFLIEGEYSFRLFLDGSFLANFLYITKSDLDFYYIYLKKSMVKNNSILEIERFRRFNKLHYITFDKDTEITFRVDHPHIVQAREIYLADVESERYLLPEEFKLECLDEYQKKRVELSSLSSIVITGMDIFITLRNEELFGKRIRYGVNQEASMGTGPVYPEDNSMLMITGTNVIYTKVDFKNTGNFDDHSYRVFNNGRICLPAQYYVKSHGSYGGIDSVRTRCLVHKGDQFTVDHTPSVYRVVYFAKEIGETGYLDLDGLIPLPLSLKYYDIYLNGLRLNHSNIEIVSPTKCYIKNVDSRQNFVIFERNHDDDSIFLTSFAYKEAGYSDSPMDEILREVEKYRVWLDNFHAFIVQLERDQLEGGCISDDAISGVYLFGDVLWNHELNCNKYDEELFLSIHKEFPNEVVDGVVRIDSVEKIEDATIYKRVNPNAYFEEKYDSKPILKGGYRYGIDDVYKGKRPKTSKVK